MTGLKDIARQLGVSPSTVSRVVNGKQCVTPIKRRRILKLVKETGYVPNHAARSMALKRNCTVGIVVSDTFDVSQKQVFSIIERSLESFGCSTMFFFVKPGSGSERDCFERIRTEQLDGIITKPGQNQRR